MAIDPFACVVIRATWCFFWVAGSKKKMKGMEFLGYILGTKIYNNWGLDFIIDVYLHNITIWTNIGYVDTRNRIYIYTIPP